MANEITKALCFTAEEAGATVSMRKSTTYAPELNLFTSYNGGGLTPFYIGVTTITLQNIGDKVYFVAGSENPRTAINSLNYNMFVITGTVSAHGSVNSLLSADFEDLTYLGRADRENCFCKLFLNCSSLVSAPELPATVVADYCYNNMFSGCSSLVSAPELPATVAVDYCYFNMFSGCSSLVHGPHIAATSLAPSCFSFMFSGCASLRSISLMYDGSFSSDYFYHWTEGVGQSGTIYYNGTDRTTGISAIPNGWSVAQGKVLMVFDFNFTDAPVSVAREYASGSAIGEFPPIERRGKTLVGWSRAASGGEVLTESSLAFRGTAYAIWRDRMKYVMGQTLSFGV